jgi:hypothetical protein
MSDFSIENVGAFELGAPVSALFDGALEATTLNPGAPTKPGWTGMCCGRIEDGALEVSADPSPRPLFTRPPFCGHIDDGALEAMACEPALTMRIEICTVRHVPRIDANDTDDSVLEASVMMGPPPLITGARPYGIICRP